MGRYLLFVTLTLKMTTAQLVETSVTNNSLSQRLPSPARSRQTYNCYLLLFVLCCLEIHTNSSKTVNILSEHCWCLLVHDLNTSGSEWFRSHAFVGKEKEMAPFICKRIYYYYYYYYYYLDSMYICIK